MDMLIIHVVLTLNHSSWLQFCIINFVTELKLSVFKKNDVAGLYEVTNDDARDRFHLAIFILATLLQTSQDSWFMLKQALQMYAMAAFIDYVKHFFLTRMNKININLYSGMRNDIFKKLHLLRHQPTPVKSPANSPNP